MIRAMLVDDEMLVRVALKSLIDWEQMGFTIVGEFEDGEKALAAVPQLRPDIVFTDMKMPRMSGLQLIQALRTLDEGIVCVILSAYHEFELVKEGMRLGAEDYLLKLDLSPESLCGLLSRVADKVRRRRTEIESTQTPEWRRSRQKFLCDFLLGEPTDLANLRRHFGFYAVKLPDADIPCLWLRVVALPPGLPPSDAERFSAMVFNLLTETLSALGEWEVVPLPQLCFALLSATVRTESPERLMRSLLTSAATVLNLHELEIREETAASIQALPVLVANFLQKSGQGGEDTEALLLLMKDDLAQERYSAFVEKLERLREGLSARPNDTSASSIRLCGVVAFLLRGATEQNVLLAGLFAEPLKALSESLSHCATEDARQRWLSEAAQAFGAAVKALSEASGAVLRAKQYIKEHFPEDVTLEKLGAHLSLSPAYVSRIFSRDVGMGAMEYLAEVRVGEAKKLLRNTRMKVYEVAFAVGIEDTHYFSRVFHRVVGETPVAFREKANKSTKPQNK